MTILPNLYIYDNNDNYNKKKIIKKIIIIKYNEEHTKKRRRIEKRIYFTLQNLEFLEFHIMEMSFVTHD